MSRSNELKQIQRALAELPTGRERRIPEQVRDWITTYARRQMAAGQSRSAVAAELGVSDPTLVRLLRRSSPRLLPVHVAAGPEIRGGLVVRGPGGLVIEGLDVDGLIALIRGLA